MTTDSNEQVKCKYCSSSDVTKHGTRRIKSGKIRQHSICYMCNRTFSIGDCRFIQDVYKRKAVVIQKYTDGKSLSGAARSANVSHITALKWIKEVTQELSYVNKVYKKLIKDEDSFLSRNYIIN